MFSLSKTKERSDQKSAASDEIVARFGRAIWGDVRELGGVENDLEEVVKQIPLRRQIADQIMQALHHKNNLPSIVPIPNATFKYVENGINRVGEIIESVPPSKFEIRDLEVVSPMKWYDFSINIKTLCKRAIKLEANLGYADALYIWEHRDEIPIKFRAETFVFPGSRLYNHNGIESFAYLRWIDAGWHLMTHPNYADINPPCFFRCVKQKRLSRSL